MTFDTGQDFAPKVLEITRKSLQQSVEEIEKQAPLLNMQLRIVGEKRLFSETISLTKVFTSSLSLKEFLNTILRANPREENSILQLVDGDNTKSSAQGLKRRRLQNKC